jgi:hypothetical protein
MCVGCNHGKRVPTLKEGAQKTMDFRFRTDYGAKSDADDADELGNRRSSIRR